ncbi:MAG: hypothetical protein ACNFW9_02050 [Candidatus Kerfeldbacteria bacterium]
MSKVTDKILETIKSKHIAPKPHWQFLIKRYLIWSMAILSTIIGSFSFSVLIFKIVNSDWDIYRYLDRNVFEHMFTTLPYIWFVFLALFIILAYYNARHTKGAYKYQAYWFVVASILVSMILGGIFYAFGFAPRVNLFAERLPILRDLMQNRDEIWLDPSNGLLAGEITEMLSGVGMFELKDFDNNVWIIISSDELVIPSHLEILKGVKVRIIGELQDKEIFEADRIMPYQMGPGIIKGGINKEEACRKSSNCKIFK